MDFTRSDAETEAASLAAQVLSMATKDQSPAAAAPGASSAADYDRSTWRELARTGLLSLALPAELGGEGLGIQATAAVLTEAGRAAARIPALATLALGVLPILHCDDTDVQRELLAGVGTGDAILTAAVREPSDPMPAVPATVATLTASRGACPGTVSGVKLGVPYAASAGWLLVPASVSAADAVAGNGAGGRASGSARTVVVVVEPDADGLSCQRSFSSAGLPEYTLRLEAAPVRHVLTGCTPGDLYRYALAGACAVADGAVAAALQLTTEHVRTRHQFGKPLASFQSVAQQIADVYATARTLHLATIAACWRLDAGLDAGADCDTAAYWLATYGPVALRTCHHLHGGLGMDVSYPLARYSALITDLVTLAGGADAALGRLGTREMADT
jgi:hypothetical protein